MARSARGVRAVAPRLATAGCDVGHLAAVFDVPEDSVRTALRQAAADADASEPLASVLRLVADGHTRAEVAEELGISEGEVTTALEALLPSSPPLPGLTGNRLPGQRAADGPPALSRAPVPAPEGVVRPARVLDGLVVRGLVERFLDDQEQRAA